MRYYPVSWMNGKILVHAAQAGNEMILERTNGTCGSIVTMNVGWGKLEVQVFSNKEIFKGIGAFVVKTVRMRS